MKASENKNHRTRVAAERREKTRARLLDSALYVFAQKGPHAVIDDVIAHAGMARGSFYNYFRTNEELLAAVARDVSNELMRAIDPLVIDCADPAVRVASGARLLLHAVKDHALFAAFVARLPFPTASSGLVGIQFLSRDVSLGISAGRFRHVLARPATDLVTGVVLSAAYSVTLQASDADYPEQMVRVLLRGLGLGMAEAARIVALVLPVLELPPESILARAGAHGPAVLV
ncbi:MAG: TetR/AcrR family transcriptional regulator [Pseudomonadota bacterium]